MYKKLEEERELKAAGEETPEGECVCVCRAEQADAEDESPAVDKAAEGLSVHYDING